jgi:hypothetical protein
VAPGSETVLALTMANVILSERTSAPADAPAPTVAPEKPEQRADTKR